MTALPFSFRRGRLVPPPALAAANRIYALSPCPAREGEEPMRGASSSGARPIGELT